MHEGATYNANMHMGGPHDVTPFIKLHATGDCGFQLLFVSSNMTVDDELFTQYNDLARGQLVGVWYETLEGHGLTVPLTLHSSSMF